MIILLHGPDSYRARKKLHYYEAGFKKKYDATGLNIVRLSGEKLDLAELSKHSGQMGFLSSKRLIMVENLISRNKSKKVQSEVVDYLDNDWSDDNVIIFIEEAELKKKGKWIASPLLKRLAKGKTEEFILLTGEKLNQWIRSEVRTRGGSIENPAVLELASLVGSDLWSMSSEIDKLIGYKNNQVIKNDDIKLMVKAKFDENIFHLTDALATKNATLSFKLLYDQLVAGAHELYILTMLTRQFRILLLAKEVMEAEPNHYTVAARLKLHPFVAQKAIRDARQFTIEELKNIYQRLLDIDIKIKSTSQDPRLLFDLLITQVCNYK